MIMLINFIMISLSILISVAFYTLLERKILSYIQIRKGPNKVGMMGILQPFSDAIKLFNKNLLPLESMNFTLSFMTPFMSLFISLCMISIMMYNYSTLIDIKHSLLMFFILSSMSVYFILLIGWSTNSKYCHLGSIRSVAQMISYEVPFFMVILFLVLLSQSYSFTQMEETQYLLYYFWGNMLLFMMWLSSCLAETNRSPFDFAEGESELVSGFNVEYMGGLFALIFLSEYLSMLILSMISTMMFFSPIKSINSMIIMIMITISLIWVRGTYPRFRYDMLMLMSWKMFLPLSMFIIIIPSIIPFLFN
uniref:NADH-ubiquinone oxidoreductase chain 1 n=1 Tax=Pardosa oreophila TaxID=74983 RepID=Q1W1L0_9ARAC|nr:NADH dehydrogenase subunit 1 [Pardosa oreophila]ABE01013.1 NADH dehydrogenase subunit 1 [Pardosa oreophila]ABE01014.1 NADH dehydrogenase subunit 1 [Pardosa oreophila]ABE01015.1 NADH dehydrogenase subunit 1 [Pardosa oreophila]ABE01016.1 NADH dehydrogenase subunit 1 [Pardosa oreophila]